MNNVVRCDEQTAWLRWMSLRQHPESAVLVLFCIIHAAMLAYDVMHPLVFLNADRASSRLETIQGLGAAWSAGTVTEYLAGHGNLGDYVPQASIMAMSGKFGLIILQVIAALAAGFAVFRLGQLLGLSRRHSTVACGVYLLLPHTLVFPHQLASEALHSPLLIISIWQVAEFISQRRPRLIVTSAVMLAAATLIRPITLIWPVVVALLLAGASLPKDGVKYFSVAMLPVIAWMTFMAMASGRFGLGESAHDMGHNLYNRIRIMSDTLPADEVPRARAEFLAQGKKGSIGVREYLRFGLRYPTAFLHHAGRDTTVFLAKSGVERVLFDYLNVNQRASAEVQDARSGWRRRLESEGILATWKHLWQSQGAVLSIPLAGSAATVVLMGFAALGGWHLIRSWSKRKLVQRFAAATLVALPLYILVFSQVVTAVQSRHRAPAEAALVLLAGIGVSEGVSRLWRLFSHNRTSMRNSGLI